MTPAAIPCDSFVVTASQVLHGGGDQRAQHDRARDILELEWISVNRSWWTGASGKTGQRMVASIAKKGGTVRAFVRRPEAGGPLKQAGAAEIRPWRFDGSRLIAARYDRRGAGACTSVRRCIQGKMRLPAP